MYDNFKARGAGLLKTHFMTNNTKPDLSGISEQAQYVVNHFLKKKLQRKEFSKLDPRHNAQMIGLEEGINSGWLSLKGDPIQKHKFYIRPTLKLRNFYFN